MRLTEPDRIWEVSGWTPLDRSPTLTGEPATIAARPIAHDDVESPSHYTRGGIETIDFIEAKGLDFHLGNAVKYISRAGHKDNAEQDIRKAIWYLHRWLRSQS